MRNTNFPQAKYQDEIQTKRGWTHGYFTFKSAHQKKASGVWKYDVYLNGKKYSSHSLQVK